MNDLLGRTVLIGCPAKNRGHSYAIFAYRMSAAFAIVPIFLHSGSGIFKVNYVENYGKTRNSTTKLVDKYVDDVDRTVNIHKKAKNIYTSENCSLRGLPAWQNRHNCKTDRAKRATASVGGVLSDRESAVNS